MRTPHLVSFIMLLTACSSPSLVSHKNAKESTLNDELFRPLYHFTPAENWMNDPNGMVYYQGEYHLFYQYHPYSTIWGPMHWGHAVSNDMIHWQHLPIALSPDEHGTIFSGSIVVDHDNTSGLGSPSKPAMVALFTYHNEERKTAGGQDYQTQGLAYSLDKGRTWVKYQHNPVMQNPGIVDFRDPKISWFAEQQKWVMVVTQGDHIGFYSSKNLIDWQFESIFGEGVGEHGGVWECPDLIRIKIAGTEQYKYVLLVSIVPSAPNGGSGTQYFVGDFDGNDFVLDKQFSAQLNEHKSLWLDYGTDNYAGVTYANVPESDGRVLFIGWMNNWQYAQQVPTTAWRSAMTIPRELSLHKTQTGLTLHSQAIREIASISQAKQQINNVVLTETADISKLLGKLPSSHKLHLQLNQQQTSKLQIRYHNQVDQSATITLDSKAGKLSIDRSQSGLVDFQEKFSGVQYGPFSANLTSYSIDIFYDKASLEVFINEGELVMTAQVFPTLAFDEIQLSTDNEVTLDTINLVPLKP